MKSTFIVGAVFFIGAYVSHGQAIKRAYCGDDATLHVIYADGKTKLLSKEPLQVACDSVTVASDEHTVGWSILVANCCTSYPIATSVAVLHNDRKRIFSGDQMIWRWQFVGDAKKLAILSGPVHGNASAATLYDIRSGRQLAKWNGDGVAPLWASGWKQEFATLDSPAHLAR